MTTTEVETITLGALAMRLGDRLDRLVTTQHGTASVQVLRGRDVASFVKQNYSVAMEWSDAWDSYVSLGWHTTPEGRHLVIRVMVRGGNKD